MSIDSDFWPDLEAQFRALVGRIRLVATVIDRRWSISSEGSTDQRKSKRIRDLFDALARRAAIATGTPNRANALEGWLNLLRKESPHFHPIGTSSPGGAGWIQDLALASAEAAAVTAPFPPEPMGMTPCHQRRGTCGSYIERV